MNVNTNHRWAGIAIILLSLLAAGCNVLQVTPLTEMKTETRSVEPGEASLARVLLQMDAGELEVAGGADELMQASFRYNVANWQPQVDYKVNGSQGELAVTQPQAENRVVARPGMTNHWTIQLNGGMPLDLTIRTGAGNGKLDLSTLDLSALKVETGAGNTTLDLSGNWNHDVKATISGGVGNLSVTLPDDMGVRVNAAAGLGGVTTAGLNKDGSGYINRAYGSAQHTLTVDINAGVGAIDLKVP